MKKTLLISVLAAAFCGAAFASEANSVQLPDGQKAVVLNASTASTKYVKSLTLEQEMGTVKTGVQVVKLSDGTCARVNTKLVSLKTLKTAQGDIQLPSVSTTVNAVKCPG